MILVRKAVFFLGTKEASSLRSSLEKFKFLSKTQTKPFFNWSNRHYRNTIYKCYPKLGRQSQENSWMSF